MERVRCHENASHHQDTPVLNFTGECDVCMEEEERHVVCQCCMKVCCKRCWRRLRKDAKSGNIPCPWKCKDQQLFRFFTETPQYAPSDHVRRHLIMFGV
eukprot:2032390-Rhodomonas_salina.1